jgi:hypothetical protein
LSANTEISPNSVAMRRPRKVSTIATPPTRTGSSAATRLRKKTKESRNRSGKASISARARSSDTCSFTWRSATSPPPSVTPGIPPSSAESRSAASLASTEVLKLAVR